MWIIDVLCFSIFVGGFVFWYHLLKRNVTSTHRVVLTQKKSYPWRVEKVSKFFGCIFRKEKVNVTETFERAASYAVQYEDELREKDAAKTICSIYEMGDLKTKLLEAPVQQEEDKKKDHGSI